MARPNCAPACPLINYCLEHACSHMKKPLVLCLLQSGAMARPLLARGPVHPNVACSNIIFCKGRHSHEQRTSLMHALTQIFCILHARDPLLLLLACTEHWKPPQGLKSVMTTGKPSQLFTKPFPETKARHLRLVSESPKRPLALPALPAL